MKAGTQVKDFAYGYAKHTRLIFFSGQGSTAMIADAKKHLLASQRLAKGQQLANFTVDFKETTILCIVHKTEVTIMAEVIDTNTHEENQPLYKGDQAISHYKELTLGDKVYLYEYAGYSASPKYSDVEGKILRFYPDKTADIGYIDNKGQYRVKRVYAYTLTKEKRETAK